MSQYCGRCQRSVDMPGQVAFCPFCGQPFAVTQTSGDPERTTAHAGPSPEQEMPESIGEYRLVRRLGQGGMGVVYEGEHPPTGRRVAVKLIDVQADDTALDRFRKEGKLASAVSHPRCVFVFAADEDAGRPFIVLELMPGRTLADEVEARGPLPVAEALAHALDLVEGLSQVHALGVIHRDVKPSNCFLDDDGRVKVGDFGLARSLQADAKLTRTGTFVGTPLYASPEQIKGEPLDARSDVYSACATLYFLLAGHAPHERAGRDALSLMAAVVSEEAPPVRPLRKDVPVGLGRLLARGLARQRERRPADLAALRAELLGFRQPLPGGRLVGARFAAYFLDMLLLTPAAHGIALWRGNNPFAKMPDGLTLALSSLVFFAYFVLFEGLAGATPGKWLFGLRVRLSGDVVAPGWARGLLRSSIYFGATSFLGAAATYALSSSPRFGVLAATLNAGLSYAGLAVLCCVMRKAKGYAMLHDLLSGTRVVAPAGSSRGQRYLSRPAAPADEGGESVGPFRVRGEAWRGDGQCVWRAIDPGLDRPVWLWLRPADAPEIPPARREEDHAGRPRWLSCGSHDGRRWDAFLAPAGAPLVESLAAVGKRPWELARPILLDLADELGREPQARYRLSQVWLTGEGRVVLLDFPLSDGDPPPPEDLLADAAVVLLEGKPAAKPRPPRAVLPTHARLALAGLPRYGESDVATFRERLSADAERPTRLGRPSRALHLGALLLAVLFSCVYVAFLPALLAGTFATTSLKVEVQKARRALERHDGECAALSAPVVAPAPTALHRLLPALMLHEYERPRAKLVEAIARAEPAGAARYERLSPVARSFVDQAVAAAPTRWRSPQDSIADWARTGPWGQRAMYSRPKFDDEVNMLANQTRSNEPFVLKAGFYGLLVPVGVCVLAALLTRRGVRSMLFGVDVVRGDGAPAGRLRCAWRVVAAWLPVVGAMGLAAWAEERAWSLWTPEGGTSFVLADVAWVAVYAVPLAVAVLALWTPARSLHDRLAGTWLVPR